MNLPNKISLTRIFSIPIFLIALVIAFKTQSNIAKYTALAVFLAISFTDVLDGYIARKTKQITETGKILDPLADKLLMISALVFMVNKGIPAWIAFVLIVMEFLFLIVGLRTFILSKPISSASWIGKAKTIVLTIGISMVIIELPPIVVISIDSFYVLLLGVVLSIISAIDYTIKMRWAFLVANDFTLT